MSKMHLPTSSSINWGGTLNAYLSNLENRVNTLEQNIIAVEDNPEFEAMRSLGTASSGMVGKLDVKVEELNGVYTCTLTQPDFYIAGDVCTRYTPIGFENGSLIAVVYDEKGDEEFKLANGDNNFYFLTLVYVNDQQAADNNDRFQFRFVKRFDTIDFKSIILGCYNPNDEQFAPIYYSSLKTVMQHLREMQERWADLDTTGTKISINYSGTALTATFANNYTMYADGIGSNEDNSKKYLDSKSLNTKVITNSEKTIRIKDSANKESGLITTTIDSGGLTTLYVYRLMFDIFGNCIIQKSAESLNSDFTINDIRNMKFNFNIVGDLALDAGLFIEVGRFCSSSTSGLYTQGSNQYPSGFTYVPSSNNANQMSLGTWQQGVGEFNLKAAPIVTRITSSSATNVLWYDANSETNLSVDNVEATNIACINLTARAIIGNTINGATITSNSFNGAAITPESFNGVTIKNGQIGSLTINGNKINGVTLSDGKVENISENGVGYSLDYNKFTFKKANEDFITLSTTSGLNMGYLPITNISDKRAKENIQFVTESFLDTVENVPVYSFHYKNSDKRYVGIMAQDLEENLHEYAESFVSIQDTETMKNKRSLYETKLTYILWKALQEEVQERKKLEKRVEELENK